MSFKVIGIGEVLWDMLPDGPQLGGAPANFAYHAHALGARAQIVSRVGDDDKGREIIRRLEAMGLAGQTLQVDKTAHTGTVTVALTDNGIPEFTIHENVAWDYIEVMDDALAALGTADAVCFGSLAQRGASSRAAIQHLLSMTPAGALRIFDVNLRQQFYSRGVIERSLELANVLKLNDGELPVLADMFTLPGGVEQQIAALAERFELRVVALTRGPQGSLLYRDGRWSECKSRPVNVKDTVGAGDAFTAALAMGLLKQMDLDDIHFAAGEVASYVCICDGATPLLPESIRALFQG